MVWKGEVGKRYWEENIRFRDMAFRARGLVLLRFAFYFLRSTFSVVVDVDLVVVSCWSMSSAR